MKLHEISLKCSWSWLHKKVAIPLQASTTYSWMTFTVTACRSEHYPIRQWHMVRNKAFVLRDLKIRIVFPLNQWAVCFTAMNNASPLQTCLSPPSLPSFPSLPSCSVFVIDPTEQCLKCFHTFALHNKVKVLIPLWECYNPPRLTGEDARGKHQRCQPDLLLCNISFEMIQSGNRC